MRSKTTLITALTALALTTSPASAQKSADSVRLALSEPVSVVSAFFDLGRENGFFSRQVFDTLITYDQVKGTYLPLLAKSWTRVSPTSIEFELRDDVKFHNGNSVDADDVVYTINWLIDPASKIQLPARYNWIAKAEKLGPYKVRLTSREVTATDLLSYSIQIAIYDEQVHKPLAEKIDYDRAPVGSGAFKIVQVDSNKGIVAVRNDAFNHGVDGKQAAVRSIQGLPVPDRDVQIAHLLAGSLDAIRDPNEDQLHELSKIPTLDITSLSAFYMLFLQFDAINRSGRKELQDPRVRKALIMAIDRNALVQSMISGGSSAQIMDAMCFREMLACDYSTKPPDYDPAGAKKLLAEAGYPDGFDLELTSRPSTKEAAIAITGYWRKIGVRAVTDLVTITVFNNKRGAGKLQAYFGERPYSSMPDASYALDVNFASEARDYWRDPMLLKATEEGTAILDEAQRKALYRAAFDRMNTEYYMVPISSLPQTFVHAKGLAVTASATAPFNVDISNFSWK